jgi:hypothetical protein
MTTFLVPSFVILFPCKYVVVVLVAFSLSVESYLVRDTRDILSLLRWQAGKFA